MDMIQKEIVLIESDWNLKIYSSDERVSPDQY